MNARAGGRGRTGLSSRRSNPHIGGVRVIRYDAAQARAGAVNLSRHATPKFYGSRRRELICLAAGSPVTPDMPGLTAWMRGQCAHGRHPARSFDVDRLCRLRRRGAALACSTANLAERETPSPKSPYSLVFGISVSYLLSRVRPRARQPFGASWTSSS